MVLGLMINWHRFFKCHSEYIKYICFFAIVFA